MILDSTMAVHKVYHSNVRYAGLYFCICVDVSDNNLYYLEVLKSDKTLVVIVF